LSFEKVLFKALEDFDFEGNHFNIIVVDIVIIIALEIKKLK